MNLTGRPPYAKGTKPAVSKVMRDSAKGQDCMLGLEGCRNDPATVVAAHLRVFGIAGMGQKPDDLFTIFACDKCHAETEGGRIYYSTKAGWDDLFRAFVLTLIHRRANGEIRLPGE